MTRRPRLALAALVLAFALVFQPVAAEGSEAPADATPTPSATDVSARGWVWPLAGARISQPYVAPAGDYGPGHRGIDLAPRGEPRLRSPADGVIAFSGAVAGRGILTIDHGDGLVTTLEPVASTLTPGMRVARGEDVGEIAAGGHAAAGTVHFGVRLEGRYINPLVLLGGVPRAVLLPCCG